MSLNHTGQYRVKRQEASQTSNQLNQINIPVFKSLQNKTTKTKIFLEKEYVNSLQIPKTIAIRQVESALRARTLRLGRLNQLGSKLLERYPSIYLLIK